MRPQKSVIDITTQNVFRRFFKSFKEILYSCIEFCLFCVVCVVVDCFCFVLFFIFFGGGVHTKTKKTPKLQARTWAFKTIVTIENSQWQIPWGRRLLFGYFSRPVPCGWQAEQAPGDGHTDPDRRPGGHHGPRGEGAV